MELKDAIEAEQQENQKLMEELEISEEELENHLRMLETEGLYGNGNEVLDL